MLLENGRLRTDQDAEYMTYRKRFCTPFIVQMKDAIFSKKELRLVLEYCKYGDLRHTINRLHEKSAIPFSEMVWLLHNSCFSIDLHIRKHYS